jgi:hypothetical protein
MVPTDLTDGALGGVVTLALYGAAQLVRRRVNGKKAPPCAAHSERMTQIEGTLRVINTVLDRMVSDLRASELCNRKAESAFIIVIGQHGERIAGLEASSVAVADGIVRIEVTLAEITKQLRT